MTEALLLPRSIASAAILAEVATEHGMELAEILRGTGIDPTVLDDIEAEIQPRQELQMVANIVAVLGDVPGLGLLTGQRYHLATHGIWAFAVISSPTVRAALATAIDYMDIGSSFFGWRFVEHDAGADIVIDTSTVPDNVRTFLIERDVACVVTADRDAFGQLRPLDRIELSYPEPSYSHMHREILGCEPLFGTPVTRLTVSAEMLNLAMPQANPHTAALAERQCAELLQRRRARSGFAAQVRAALLAHGAGVSQQQVAGALRMSVRTLRRRLDEEGTSFRELADETRHMLAEELLTIGATVEDVAGRLGYADASSFSHAFIRWSGTTPGRFARDARGGRR
ncbi:AraC family transcriptional regulator [Nocardia africana]|uniref:M5 polypeptide n=1 Tax=Nocardia africana TaxID=134964 RepID=A0A378X0P7_9NOCA|nr:AraC family transcriptional regulator [Nocardia africana]MCC3312287.1 AraC family transcriptional regulator [Nocardia africana]SUA46405.1 M5 polypeptide [Nocardia africana]